MPDIKSLLGLIFIIIFSGALYFYKLDSIPNGVYVDEAATGYNAYSILKTGKDENGKPYPVAFRFLGSYSAPLYTYLTVPVVGILGLNIFSTRFISVLSGVGGVLLVYLFLNSLTGVIKSKFIPLLGSSLFAITPWNLFFSRIGYETNLAFFVYSLGVYLLWVSIEKIKYFPFAMIILSLSIYGYHTQKLLVPITLITFLIIFRNKLVQVRRLNLFILGLILGLLIQIPNITIINTPALMARSGLFYIDDIVNQAGKISNYLPHPISILLAFIFEFLARYASYFSPKSLFLLPDPDLQRSAPDLSVQYPWMIVPLIFGLYALVKDIKKNWAKMILLLLLITPIPAALTKDPFATQRALPMLLPLMVLIALGADQLLQKIKYRYSLPLFVGVIGFSLLMLWRSYFVFLPKERAMVWGYGYAQLADYIRGHPNEQFLIDQERIKPTYIELAFFLRLDPKILQSVVDPSIKQNYYSNISFDNKYKFLNIETGAINWKEDIYEDQIIVGDDLTVSSLQAKEHALTQVYEVKDPLNKVVFKAFKTDPKQKCSQPNASDKLCR